MITDCKRPSPIAARIAIVALVLLYCIVGGVLAYLFAGGPSRPPVVVHETRAGVVVPGAVHIQFRATRERDCSLTVLSEWELPDEVRRFVANPNKAVLQRGETRWLDLRIDIPADLAAGQYRVRSIGEYLCPDGQVFRIPTGWIEVKVS